MRLLLFTPLNKAFVFLFKFQCFLLVVRRTSFITFSVSERELASEANKTLKFRKFKVVQYLVICGGGVVLVTSTVLLLLVHQPVNTYGRYCIIPEGMEAIIKKISLLKRKRSAQQTTTHKQRTSSIQIPNIQSNPYL